MIVMGIISRRTCDTSFTILTKYNNINNKYNTYYLGLINANGQQFDAPTMDVLATIDTV
jgi:hypothetical protein